MKEKETGKIKILRNRYNVPNYVKEIEPDLWELNFVDNEDSYLRIGYEKINEDGTLHNIEYIDPSGGPFIMVGVDAPWDDHLKVIKITEHKVNKDLVKWHITTQNKHR